MEGCAEGVAIRWREAQLRAWFVRDCDPVRQTIDGLDIGWGGVQRWATARMVTVPSLVKESRRSEIPRPGQTFMRQLTG